MSKQETFTSGIELGDALMGSAFSRLDLALRIQAYIPHAYRDGEGFVGWQDLTKTLAAVTTGPQRPDIERGMARKLDGMYVHGTRKGYDEVRSYLAQCKVKTVEAFWFLSDDEREEVKERSDESREAAAKLRKRTSDAFSGAWRDAVARFETAKQRDANKGEGGKEGKEGKGAQTPKALDLSRGAHYVVSNAKVVKVPELVAQIVGTLADDTPDNITAFAALCEAFLAGLPLPKPLKVRGTNGKPSNVTPINAGANA